MPARPFLFPTGIGFGSPQLRGESTENKYVMVLMADKTTYFEHIFEDEFMPHSDALYNFAYHLTGNEDDANDLFQEALMKAWRFVDKYEAGTNAKAWLFTIAKNAFINEYRRKVKTPNRVELQDYVTYQDKQDTPLTSGMDMREEMFQYLIGDEVTLAINQLPVDFRTVILLSDVEDFKYDEIASILDIPIGTVRSRLHRARNLLKEKLKTYAEQLGYEDKRG
jgi:RNA polymerase sigma factor (sigma-70 family)